MKTYQSIVLKLKSMLPSSHELDLLELFTVQKDNYAVYEFMESTGRAEGTCRVSLDTLMRKGILKRKRVYDPIKNYSHTRYFLDHGYNLREMIRELTE